MSRDSVVGTIVVKERKSFVQWIISSDHLPRSFQENEYLQSPPFHFLRSSWCLRFCPNDGTFLNFATVYLIRDIANKAFALKLHIRFDVWYNGYEFKERSGVYTFYHDNQYFRRHWYDYSLPRNQYFALHIRRVNTLDMKIECYATEEQPQSMGEVLFCTRKFSSDFNKLCMSDYRSDVTIIVNKAKVPCYRAHKLILKARSPLFELIFSHDMKENREGIVNMVGYDYRTVYYFLIFLYTGKLKSCASYPDAEWLYAIAHHFGVEDLLKRSRELIEQKMSTDTLCDIFRFANFFEDSLLMVAAQKFLKFFYQEVFGSQQWREFSFENVTLSRRIREDNWQLEV